jgi:c-di-GMP-binding flagellar brake protein YcgR
MDPIPERRSARRVIVGSEHTIRFSVKGHSFREVRITNISLSGCFAMVSQRDSALFAQGALLEQFAFEHPDLAMGPVTAKVMYLLGGASEQASLDFMGVGINFLHMNPESQKILEDFLAASLRP